MATRLPYYVGGDDIYTQLMRQFESEVPYYSAAPAGIAGGYDPSLYSRLMPAPSGGEFTGDYSGLLGGGGGGDFGMQATTAGTTGGGFSFGGLLGGGPSSTAAPGTVSTGMGGVSLSPSGTVTANTVSVPAAFGLGLVTGLPLGLIATMSNQSAAQAANALSTALSDTMGMNADSSTAAATADPGGTGGAAAAAPSAAAAAAAAAGLSDAAQGAAAQAAANAVVSGMSPSAAAAAGASAAAAATTGEVGIAGLATGFTDGGTAGGDASGIAGLSTGFSDSGAIGVGVGGGGGGGACVIATHAVANGAFTPNEKRQAVKWCVKNLHRTWWGEAIRRGYRYYGRKAIKAGKAKNHYQEFRDYVAFATGTRKTPRTALTFAWRNVQFFVTGIFVKD